MFGLIALKPSFSIRVMMVPKSRRKADAESDAPSDAVSKCKA